MFKCEHYEDEEDQKVYYEMYKLAMVIWKKSCLSSSAQTSIVSKSDFCGLVNYYSQLAQDIFFAD